MANAVRMSFTVPAELAASISQVAERLKVSRSALLAQLLTEPMAELQRLIELVPPKPTEGDILRFRGESVALINQLVTEAQEVAKSVDPAPKLDL